MLAVRIFHTNVLIISTLQPCYSHLLTELEPSVDILRRISTWARRFIGIAKRINFVVREKLHARGSENFTRMLKRVGNFIRLLKKIQFRGLSPSSTERSCVLEWIEFRIFPKSRMVLKTERREVTLCFGTWTSIFRINKFQHEIFTYWNFKIPIDLKKK